MDAETRDKNSTPHLATDNQSKAENWISDQEQLPNTRSVTTKMEPSNPSTEDAMHHQSSSRSALAGADQVAADTSGLEQADIGISTITPVNEENESLSTAGQVSSHVAAPQSTAAGDQDLTVLTPMSTTMIVNPIAGHTNTWTPVTTPSRRGSVLIGGITAREGNSRGGAFGMFSGNIGGGRTRLSTHYEPANTTQEAGDKSSGVKQAIDPKRTFGSSAKHQPHELNRNFSLGGDTKAHDAPVATHSDLDKTDKDPFESLGDRATQNDKDCELVVVQQSEQDRAPGPVNADQEETGWQHSYPRWSNAGESSKGAQCTSKRSSTNIDPSTVTPHNGADLTSKNVNTGEKLQGSGNHVEDDLIDHLFEEDDTVAAGVQDSATIEKGKGPASALLTNDSAWISRMSTDSDDYAQEGIVDDNGRKDNRMSVTDTFRHRARRVRASVSSVLHIQGSMNVEPAASLSPTIAGTPGQYSVSRTRRIRAHLRRSVGDLFGLVRKQNSDESTVMQASTDVAFAPERPLRSVLKVKKAPSGEFSPPRQSKEATNAAIEAQIIALEHKAGIQSQGYNFRIEGDKKTIKELIGERRRWLHHLETHDHLPKKKTKRMEKFEASEMNGATGSASEGMSDASQDANATLTADENVSSHIETVSTVKNNTQLSSLLSGFSRHGDADVTTTGRAGSPVDLALTRVPTIRREFQDPDENFAAHIQKREEEYQEPKVQAQKPNTKTKLSSQSGTRPPMISGSALSGAGESSSSQIIQRVTEGENVEGGRRPIVHNDSVEEDNNVTKDATHDDKAAVEQDHGPQPAVTAGGSAQNSVREDNKNRKDSLWSLTKIKNVFRRKSSVENA